MKKAISELRRKYGRKWRKINAIMGREENKLKNEYLRHIFPKFKICDETLKNQKHNFD
jgi:hypothetical protein